MLRPGPRGHASIIDPDGRGPAISFLKVPEGNPDEPKNRFAFGPSPARRHSRDSRTRREPPGRLFRDRTRPVPQTGQPLPDAVDEAFRQLAALDGPSLRQHLG